MKSITTRTLVKRINRHLEPDRQVLKKTATWRLKKRGLGNYYILDLRRNAPLYLNVDLAKFARERGLLADEETVRDRLPRD